MHQVARTREPAGLTEEQAALWSQPYKDPEMQMPVGETDPGTYYEYLIDSTAEGYMAKAGDNPDLGKLADELDARLSKTGVEGLDPPSPELWSLVVVNLRARASGVWRTVEDRSEEFVAWRQERREAETAGPAHVESAA